MEYIAEMGRSTIGMILSGRRKIEPVFMKKERMPYNVIGEEDVLYFRSVDGYAVGKATITKVEHHSELNPEKVQSIIAEHKSDIQPDELMMSKSLYSNYATLMWLDNVQEIPPFRVIVPPETKNTKWITIKNIEKIRGY